MAKEPVHLVPALGMRVVAMEVCQPCRLAKMAEYHRDAVERIKRWAPWRHDHGGDDSATYKRQVIGDEDSNCAFSSINAAKVGQTNRVCTVWERCDVSLSFGKVGGIDILLQRLAVCIFMDQYYFGGGFMHWRSQHVSNISLVSQPCGISSWLSHNLVLIYLLTNMGISRPEIKI